MILFSSGGTISSSAYGKGLPFDLSNVPSMTACARVEIDEIAKTIAIINVGLKMLFIAESSPAF
jgi:hypothetical protein